MRKRAWYRRAARISRGWLRSPTGNAALANFYWTVRPRPRQIPDKIIQRNAGVEWPACIRIIEPGSPDSTPFASGRTAGFGAGIVNAGPFLSWNAASDQETHTALQQVCKTAPAKGAMAFRPASLYWCG